jgi:hypothetical protein
MFSRYLELRACSVLLRQVIVGASAQRPTAESAPD